MKTQQKNLETKIRRMIVLFIVGLILSGVTAFPIETELSVIGAFAGNVPGPLTAFVLKVYDAVKATNTQYPFLAYGTDWLAFAHIVIAVVFIGPYKDPVKNIWVIEFGMISCLMVFPLAFICGWIREIPVYWQLIDCSFGVFGLIPLIYTHQLIRKLERLLTLSNIYNEKK